MGDKQNINEILETLSDENQETLTTLITNVANGAKVMLVYWHENRAGSLAVNMTQTEGLAAVHETYIARKALYEKYITEIHDDKDEAK